MHDTDDQAIFYTGRHYFVLLVLLGLLAGLIGRALYLQIVEKDFFTSLAPRRRSISLPDKVENATAVSLNFGIVPLITVLVNKMDFLVRTIESLKSEFKLSSIFLEI